MTENYLERATDPQQYDSQAFDWKVEGLTTSPTRRLYQEHLREYLDVIDKTVIDIGSGMGQLFPLLKQLGAKEILGIEPSKGNAEISNQLYPNVPVLNATLAGAVLDKKYDVALALFVLNHISNVDVAFKKIGELLNKEGIFYTTIWDMGYALTPRFDYQIDTQIVDNKTTAVKTTRSYGTMYDLVRPMSTYVESAEENGFTLIQHTTLEPTESYIALDPKYKEFRNKTIAHLLILKVS